MTTSIEYRRQQNALDTLEVIKKFFDKNGYTPTQNQISVQMGKSRGAIYPRLQRLREMGEIDFDTVTGQIRMDK